MDFLDELNSITKTKMEVEQDEYQGRLKKEREWRHDLISKIKDEIKKKASSGDFIVIGSQKKISGVIDRPYTAVTEKRYESYTKTMSRDKGLGIFTKPKREVKIVATPWFLEQIKLMEEEIIQEGLPKIKIRNAIYFEGEYRVYNEIESLTSEWANCGGGHIHYEIEF